MTRHGAVGQREGDPLARDEAEATTVRWPARRRRRRARRQVRDPPASPPRRRRSGRRRGRWPAPAAARRRLPGGRAASISVTGPSLAQRPPEPAGVRRRCLRCGRAGRAAGRTAAPHPRGRPARPVGARGRGSRGRRRGRAGARRTGGPHGGGVLRRRQHDHAGRVDLPPGPRPPPPPVLHHPRHPRRRLAAGLVPAWSASRTPTTSSSARTSALGVHRGAPGQRARGAQRGDLRRGDGAPDLAGHPRACPAAPRPRPAGVAGDRGAGRDRRASSPAGWG